MATQVANNLRFRRHFGKIKRIIDIPNLIDIQKRSYDEFQDLAAQWKARADAGLSPREETELHNWADADPRHRGHRPLPFPDRRKVRDGRRSPP